MAVYSVLERSFLSVGNLEAYGEVDLLVKDPPDFRILVIWTEANRVDRRVRYVKSFQIGFTVSVTVKLINQIKNWSNYEGAPMSFGTILRSLCASSLDRTTHGFPNGLQIFICVVIRQSKVAVMKRRS